MSAEDRLNFTLFCCLALNANDYITTCLDITGQVLHAVMLRIAQIAMSTSFHLFAESSAAKGDKGARDDKTKLSP